MPKIKKSYGIICCRNDSVTGVQIILIKKPVTYHFCEFVSGNYRKFDDHHLRNLFNNMTYHEKMDILSLKFSNMWYRVYKHIPDQGFENTYQTKQYTRKKAKFETCFRQDGGVRLKKLMANTVNSETLWEIPKGRRNDQANEGYINAGIREFTEETLISSDKYEILWHLNPYIETYTDFGITYQNTYFYATAVGDWNPSIVFSNGQQIAEVSAIRWCSFLDIKAMQLDPKTHNRLIKMFKKITTKYKNALRYSHCINQF